MTEIHITITRQPDGELRVKTEGHGHKAHPDEVDLGQKLIAALQAKFEGWDGKMILKTDVKIPSHEIGEN